jgi:RND superfamily putative drug exporter
MQTIARFITGRRSKYLVVLLVLALAGALASQAGKVVLTSDPAVLLPDGAESVRALRAIERFPSGDVTPAIVVVERPDGLTAADREALAELDTDLPGAGRAAGPQPSEDGTAAVLVVPFSGVGEDELVGAV